MNTRNRVFLGILLIYVLGVAFLLYRIINDLDPRYRESAEESLVETAHLLASFIERDLADGALGAHALRPTFQALYARRFDAQIYALKKDRVELRVYVTDGKGTVVFDSLGKAEGHDYAGWRDVQLTLRGEYGARTTRDIPEDPSTSVMYVAAPIFFDDKIVGAVTVGKPVQSFGQFVAASRQKIIQVGTASVIAILILVVIASVWLVRPFAFITDMVRYTRSQRHVSPRRLARRALSALTGAYGEMRDALAGRQHISEYVQTLTHEIKSPLSAIRGAAELLREPMPETERRRFLANVERESQRLQELVDRLLELSTLEMQHRLERVETIDLRQVVTEAVETAQPAAARRRVVLKVTGDAPAAIEGNRFWLVRAVTNLIDNAIDFSPDGETIDITLTTNADSVELRVRDRGPGVPAYAIDKVFDKFYSLARPQSKKKSTGLGLSLVREIAELHYGSVTLANANGGGAVAVLKLHR
jgi:two-component system, OmpR family, sensor histidine kinase CreC